MMTVINVRKGDVSLAALESSIELKTETFEYDLWYLSGGRMVIIDNLSEAERKALEAERLHEAEEEESWRDLD